MILNNHRNKMANKRSIDWMNSLLESDFVHSIAINKSASHIAYSFWLLYFSIIERFLNKSENYIKSDLDTVWWLNIIC